MNCFNLNLSGRSSLVPCFQNVFSLFLQITDMPLGRIPVETHIFEGNETGFKDVYSVMAPAYKQILQDFVF